MNRIREIIHVLPIDDSNYHIEDFKCHCNPKIEELENGNCIVTHNSFDGRELKEWNIIIVLTFIMDLYVYVF